jgi:DNA-directed RNA polymerase
MPNLIHSLDGTTIALLVNFLKNLGISNLYTIHDCFASTANNISIINEYVRESFCQTYADVSFLFNLHIFFMEYILGNYKIYCKDTSEFITDAKNIKRNEALSFNYEVYFENKTIIIPKLPETGDFKNIRINIKNATYLLN